MQPLRVIVAGGGAAGFFAAIACAERNPAARVTICEATARPLAKVRIAGGGRCNLTHACFEPDELARHYPRGGRELRGPLHRWGPRDTVAWFEGRGVALKTEADGRMFPVTDDSATVVDCLLRAAQAAGVALRTRCGIKAARAGFAVELTTGETAACDRLLLATGGGAAGAGLEVARALGHRIEPPVPSLFTFHVDDPRLAGLAGVSVGAVEVAVPEAGLREAGAILVTHEGLSGPAVLRLSAWGARPLHDRGYRFPLTINWVPPHTVGSAEVALERLRAEWPRRQVAARAQFGLPQRLWERLTAAAGIAPATAWTSASNQALQALAAELARGRFAVDGKSLFKDEFVTCGGVRLAEVDFRSMASRRCPGLFFAGEILDLDGLTGGFNLQSAWTTGWIAGQAMAV